MEAGEGNGVSRCTEMVKPEACWGTAVPPLGLDHVVWSECKKSGQVSWARFFP